MLLQELPAFSPTTACPPLPANLTPQGWQGFKWQTGLPSRQDPSLPNKGQILEEEGQEVEDNMSLGIHLLTTLKLTQSLIQNLAFGTSWMTKNFHRGEKRKKKKAPYWHMRFPTHTCTAVNAGREGNTTLSQIWQISRQPGSKPSWIYTRIPQNFLY